MDTLYHYFTIEQNTGIVCPIIHNDILSEIVVNSSLSYVDPYTTNTCYNLMIYASNRLLTFNDLLSTNYDSHNCSFTYLKVCTVTMKKIYKPPVLNGTDFEKSIFLTLLN